MLYKLYFYDFKLKDTYPVTVWQNDIYRLASWINEYLTIWNMQYVKGEVLDRNHCKIDDVHFIPSEVIEQRFIGNPRDRLIEYYKYHFEEEGVLH